MSLQFMGIRIDGSRLIFGDHDGVLPKWFPLVDYYMALAEAGTKEINLDVLSRRDGTLNKVFGLEGGPSSHINQFAISNLARRKALSYENSVSILLKEMSDSKTAQAVFNAIQRQEMRRMTISPYFITLGVDLNAGAFDDPHSQTIPRNWSDKRGIARLRERRSKDAIIRFTPRQWGYRLGPMHASVPFRNLSGPGFEPDEMLLHEMVHGLRDMTGLGGSRWARRDVPGQALQGNMEEFYAVLIANIYRSERRRTGLRQYYSIVPISPSTYTTTNNQFLNIERNRMHLRQLRRQQPQLFNDLNDIDAPFNPTREFKDR